PSAVAWSSALDNAGHALGVTLAGKALHADNLKRFEALLRATLEKLIRAAAGLPGKLVEGAQVFGVGVSVDRAVTARSGDKLVAALAGQNAVAQVNALAGFVAKTSARAVGKSLASSPDMARLLGDALIKGVFEQLTTRKAELTGAAELLESAA